MLKKEELEVAGDWGRGEPVEDFGEDGELKSSTFTLKPSITALFKRQAVLAADSDSNLITASCLSVSLNSRITD